MTEATREAPSVEAVAELGQLFEVYGWPRLVGRVLGHLLLADPPYLSTAELCEQLQVSKGHLSSAIQMLSGMGMIERFGMPGSRRDHYRLASNAFWTVLRRSVEPTQRMADFAERARAHVAPGSRAAEQLAEMHGFYGLLAARLPEIIAEFEAGRRAP